jgi:hypothetical protein
MTGPNTPSRLNSRRSGGLGINPIGNDAAIKYININLQSETITVNCKGVGYELKEIEWDGRVRGDLRCLVAWI